MCAKRKTGQKKLVDYSKSFYSDLELPSMYHGLLIRSPLPCGSVKSITHPCLPDGYTIITARDIPGEKYVTILKTKIPIFAHKEVTYLGEPIGMIVGPDINLLNKLQKEIIIRFKKTGNEKKIEELSNLPETEATDSQVNLEDKEKPDLKKESTEIATNLAEENKSQEDFFLDSNEILAQRTIFSEDDPEMVYAESDTQIEGNYSAGMNIPVCSETVGGIAHYNHGMMTLYSNVYWFSQLRKSVSDVIGIDATQIEFIKTLSVGGRTNNIWYSVIVLVQLALAAFICGKPVKLVFSREEQKNFIDKNMPVVINHRTAISPQGKIQTMIISIAVDGGKYNPFIQEIVDRVVVTARGIYNSPTYKISAYVVSSATSPYQVNFQWLDSQVAFALENQIQRICKKIGFLPEEFRRINCFPSPISPFRLDLSNYDKLIENALNFSGFSRRYASYQLAAEKRQKTGDLSFSVPIRGIGIATSYEGCGFLCSDYYASSLNIKVTMEIDGSVVIHSYPPSASVQQIWVNLVSKMLEVSPENVRVDSNFDVVNEPKYPAGFFGNIGLMTHLLKKCCTGIQRQRFRHPLPISVSRGITSQQKKQWNEENFCGIPFYDMATGAAIVEVELDTCTYKINIRNMWIVVDGGEIMSAPRVFATLKNSVRQMLSSMVKGEILDASNIEIKLLHSSSDSKQIGGLVHNLIPAAFVSAVSQAFGKDFESLPLDPTTIYQPVIDLKNQSEPEGKLEGKS